LDNSTGIVEDDVDARDGVSTIPMSKGTASNIDIDTNMDMVAE